MSLDNGTTDTTNLSDAGQAPDQEPAAQAAEQPAVDAAADGESSRMADTAETPDAPEAPARRVAELEAELERERSAATDYMQRWQRAAADLANFRRRMQTEQEQRERMAAGRALALMLPALDNFERAFSTLPDSLRGYSWISGLALIEMQLQGALSASGARPIAAEPGQPFNPQVHEAVGEIETAEHPAGSVALILQRGYELEGVLLRPALVQVAKAPGEASTSPAEAEQPPPHAEAEAPPTDAATKEEAS
jgi:molecular chaperone GrpE